MFTSEEYVYAINILKILKKKTQLQSYFKAKIYKQITAFILKLHWSIETQG